MMSMQVIWFKLFVLAALLTIPPSWPLLWKPRRWQHSSLNVRTNIYGKTQMWFSWDQGLIFRLSKQRLLNWHIVTGPRAISPSNAVSTRCGAPAAIPPISIPLAVPFASGPADRRLLVALGVDEERDDVGRCIFGSGDTSRNLGRYVGWSCRFTESFHPTYGGQKGETWRIFGPKRSKSRADWGKFATIRRQLDWKVARTLSKKSSSSFGKAWGLLYYWDTEYAPKCLPISCEVRAFFKWSLWGREM